MWAGITFYALGYVVALHAKRLDSLGYGNAAVLFVLVVTGVAIYAAKSVMG